MPFDRRKLLKSVPAGIAALMLPRSAAAESKGGEPPLDGSVDVAIVGGGVAGCYVAYRLLNGELGAGSPLAELAAKNGGKLNIGLFEYSGRVGGRMLSAEIPQKLHPDLGIGEGPGNRDTGERKHAEFGGFRFQPQMHIVADLAEHLGLEHEPFPVDEPPENPIYLRGKRFLNGTLPAPADLPYNFTESENVVMAGGGSFETYVENQAFAGYLPDTNDTASNPALKPYPGPGEKPVKDKPPPGPNGWIYLRTRYQAAFQAKDWLNVEALRQEYETAKQVARVDGRLVNDWSWWALMTRFLSSEAIAFLEDSGGYNSLWSPGNVPANVDEDFYFPTAADLYPTIYNGPVEGQIKHACTETAWRHIASGYSDIPNRLYQGFLAKGGTGYLQHQLLSFDHDGAGGYVLRFFQRESGTLSTAEAEQRCQADPASCRTYGAKYVILTLPRRSLELLDQENFFFTNPTVNQLLGSVLDVPAMRIFMAYERPWWTEAETIDENGVRYPAPTCGRSTTDLRVRQFYYWHTATDGGNSFVLASYVNAEAERYWRELQEGPGPYDRYQGAVPPTGPPRFDAAQGHGPRAGSDDMGKFAHQDLVKVIGPLKDKATPPLPYYIHYQNWTKDPWGAGWHAWTAGNNEVTLIPRILQPLPDEHLYLCGETYSNVQGWVQGALNTSEVMLQKKLGLAYPTWLKPGGTWLGPGSEGIPVT